jgi:hypothetical protein
MEMMKPPNWEKSVLDLESRAGKVNGGEDARALKNEVSEAVSRAESDHAPAGIVDRLDQLLMKLTQAARENVCTNTKCPHYNKKCKMR